MTHDELMSNLEYPWVDEMRVVPRADKYRLALRAVVELHKRVKPNRCQVCWTAYPCPTIQAIEKELS